jgi:acyl-homoserine lactone acylase PvdQ
MLPTLGTGAYDWHGFISRNEHPHSSSPPRGLFLNWNNKPAPGWIGGDDVHSWTSVHRVKAFDQWPKHPRLQDVVSVMNRAATEDLRGTEVWPVIRAVLQGSPPPTPLAGAAANLVTRWSHRGAPRVDRNDDGKVDDPGAAVMDAAFPRIADAVLAPRLGDLTSQFATLMGRDDAPAGRNGSSFGGGWYGIVSKDLRTQLGRKVKGRYRLRYCGAGNLAACRASLWAAVDAAATQLAATQGSNPAAWRSDANAERIHFTPGLIPDTMRWTNRSTFQQVIELAR